MRLIPALALAAVAFALAGCGAFEKTQTGPLVPGPGFTIQDVPVPAGFKYTEEGSYANVQAELKLRDARQNYYGKAALLRVAEFYQEQLPKNKWTAVTVEQLPGKVIVKATKPGEEVVVSAWDETMYTYINIRLEPVGKKLKN